MFFSVFAVMSSLISVMGQTSAQHHDFNSMINVRDNGSSESELGYVGYSSSFANDRLFHFNDLDNFIPSGVDYVNKNSYRYYISNDPQNVGNDLGYIEFYFEWSNDTGGFLYPVIKNSFTDTFNLIVSADFRIYNSDFPSLTMGHSVVFDFTNPKYKDYYWIDEQNSSMYTIYTNSQDKNSVDIAFSIISVNQYNWNDYNNTYTNGYDNGYSEGYNDGKTDGYQNGYTQGIQDSLDTNSTAQVIFTGILDVGLLPINFFLACLNFEVFGINIGGFVSALLTIAIVIIIIRIVLGGKKED